MRIYILALVLLILQSSIVIKNLSVMNFTPDFLVILIILYTLNHGLKDSLKFSIFVGILQDMLNPVPTAFNLISKLLLTLATFSVKNRFFLGDIFIRSILIILLSVMDITVKILLTFLKTGIFYINVSFFAYVFLNFLIFYIVQIINENRQI
ncbi:MAG TPA: rod shape-determining protein MreD [Persephonella sp.]|uniref:rod shape-determining protein MreD n=1 Tax=Persephonella TaxID=182899 RepID=UPI00059F26FC|nr:MULTISPECIES: rod shape-determining protein MreD [Persephonella]HCB70528.1 rod shape-determining protein MreD [Persephonella sp.]